MTTLVRRGLEAEGATADEEAISYLVDRAGGDGRQILTALEVAIALGGQARDRGRRRRRARHEGDPVRHRRPLRRDQRVHQVAARLGRRRRAALARSHARGRRGRPLHRAAHGDLRLRGRRDGRSDGVVDRKRRGACRRVRRASRGAAQPLAGVHPPRDRAEVEPRRARHLERARGRAQRRRWRGAAPPARHGLLRARRPWATARATCTLTTTRGDGSTSSTVPTTSVAACTTSPPTTGSKKRCGVGWKLGEEDR